MTTTTERDVRSQINGRVPGVDSPAVHARARARISDTDGDVKPTKVRSPSRVAGLANWWVWTAQPASFAGTWAGSKVDRSRIPANNTVLFVLWQVSQWTDRLVMFALILALPAILTGPLRWCAARPARRYTLYLTAAAFVAACLIGV